MRLKPVLIAVVVIALSFVAALKVMDWMTPRSAGPPPKLVELPPLTPAQSSTSITAPIKIPLATIRDAADRAAPKTFAGTADNPVPQLLQNADIQWSAARGPIAVTGAQDVMSLSTPLNGALNVKGSLSSNVRDAIGNAIGGLLGGNAAKQIGSINIKNLNATADIRGSVGITAKPTLAANWRIEPNLAAQVNLGDTNLSLSGVRINVPAQVKPMIDRAVNEQLAGLSQRIRNDPALEQSARREWTKLCRSVPLQGAAPLAPGVTLPNLWLEIKPTRAVAAQPKVDAAAMTLTLGVEAETRITAAQTQPDCPFPAALALVPPGPGKISVGVPVDLPFTEIDKIVQAQVVGKTFPDDGNGAVGVTVKSAGVNASGDRLLISMLVNEREKKSYFGLAGDASVYIWGRPVLDSAQQILRLTDIELAVESEAAFGLMGAAARAAIPYLKQALAERATIDLKPLAANAKAQIAKAIGDLQKTETGIRITADISSIRLAGIAFDSTMLRVTADAQGTADATITALPGL